MKRAAAFALIVLASASGVFAATSVIVSIPDQKLAVFEDGERVASFRVSTSRFGIGDKSGSYATPLGKLEVADKIGAGLKPGAVLKARHATGEVLHANARGRDPIVTRILHLRGCESCNDNAYARGIYIHGTPVERSIGKPDSYGCIRMRSADVIELFDMIGERTSVEIVNDPLTRSAAYYTATHPAPAPIAERKTDEKKSAPAAETKVPAQFFSAPIAAVKHPAERNAVVTGSSASKLNKPAVDILGAPISQSGPDLGAQRSAGSGVVFGRLAF